MFVKKFRMLPSCLLYLALLLLTTGCSGAPAEDPSPDNETPLQNGDEASLAKPPK